MSFYVRLALYRAIIRNEPNYARPETKISSSEISEKIGMNATQIRRDLSQLGRNGKRGMGYSTTLLLPILDRALAKHWPQVLEEAEQQKHLFELVLEDAP